MRENCDFAALWFRLSTATRDDSLTLAKVSRPALLENWSGVAAADAAQYVMDHPAEVHADQMAVVVGKWAESAPEEAREWLGQAPAGEARDEGLAALAGYWLGRGEAVEAWSCAALVGDAQRRVKVATEVFVAWEKTDRAAAEKAWEGLFQPETGEQEENGKR